MVVVSSQATPPCLNRGLNGLRGLRGLPLTALPPLHRSHPLCPSQDLSPRPPLFASLIVGYACAYEEGGAHGFLKVCIPGYSDGFERMDHTIETQIPLAIPLAKPITVPPSSQEGG